MPSSSKKQHNFMNAVARSPAFAKKVGVPQSVGKDFSTADKGRKFKESGDTMANTSRMNRLEELGRVNAEKASTAKGKRNLMAEKKRVVGELKMAKGGIATSLKAHASAPASKAHAGMKSGGMTKMGAVNTSSKPDGIAVKGKTKGTMVKMARGGKSC
jgi:hypothetical protein